MGPLNAIGVGAYIALAGLIGEPVSGASMNPVRSLAPALVLNDWTAWWVYLIGPLAGAAIAVGFAWILRGPGGGFYETRRARRTRDGMAPGTPRLTSATTRRSTDR